MDDCRFAFDPGCEVLYEKYPLKINIPTKTNLGKNISQDFINKHSYYTFKNQHFLVIISLGERITDNCQFAFDPGCEVLEMGIFKN